MAVHRPAQASPYRLLPSFTFIPGGGGLDSAFLQLRTLLPARDWWPRRESASRRPIGLSVRRGVCSRKPVTTTHHSPPRMSTTVAFCRR